MRLAVMGNLVALLLIIIGVTGAFGGVFAPSLAGVVGGLVIAGFGVALLMND